MSAALSNEILSFGPFRLSPAERFLTKHGERVEISGRAYDILLMLASRHSELVSKSELLNEVWPGISVEEGSLRFHIANLRKLLGDGKEGARYIATSSGRGYTFVAQVHRSQGQAAVAVEAGRDTFQHANLPTHYAMVDREDDIEKLPARVLTARFVTVVGAGGIGKTTLAVAAGHRLAPSFAGAVVFVDLSMVSNPALVGTILASLLGLSVQSDDATPGILTYLKSKSLLLILDTCEHLAAAVATLASAIFVAAPKIHILATSREALQTDGETVYRLEPLPCPPGSDVLTAEVALTFPAIQLFIERARASGAQLDFSDEEAAAVVGICRKLDGMALAIELAARRVKSYGVQQTAALLGERLTLSWPGPRNAPARQKTLHATMDWSYSLLTEIERVVLRRIAVFVGDFTLEAVLAVVTGVALDNSIVLDAIDSLVSKSMIAARPIGAMIRYRLLDTTRAYALQMSVNDTELAALAIRHATYCRRWLEQDGTKWSTLSTGLERAPHFAGLNNTRAALEWCFAESGDVKIGVSLAAAAAPVLLAMSLFTECHHWSECAILALDDHGRGGVEEMHLQAGLALSLIFTRGESEEARTAASRSLAIAEHHDDAINQLQLLGLLHMFHHRTGDFTSALSYAKRSVAVSGTVGDDIAIASAHCIHGVTLHHMGDFARARVELEAALQQGASSRHNLGIIQLGLNHHNWASGTLARNMWLQGHPAQAAELARRTVEEAARLDRPLALSIALNCAVTVFLWIGDLESADEHIDWLISHADSHLLGPFMAVGQGFRGELAIRRGNLRDGVNDLQSCLSSIHAARYKLLASSFTIALVEGLAASGRSEQGMALVDERIRLDQADGALSYVPELLRAKGKLLLAMSSSNGIAAEACFCQSLELSGEQGAVAWQLRTTVDLADLFAKRGEAERARALLEPLFKQFPDMAATIDMQVAERLLATLN